VGSQDNQVKRLWFLYHFRCDKTWFRTHFFFFFPFFLFSPVLSWLQCWRLLGTKVAMNSCLLNWVFPPSVYIALGSSYFIRILLTRLSKTPLSKNLAWVLFFWIWLALLNEVLSRIKYSLSSVSSYTHHIWIAHLFITCMAYLFITCTATG